MNKNELENIQWKIRLAVQRLHKKYYKCPHIFITESDIKCMLYSELLSGFSKKSCVNSLDRNGERLDDWDYGVVTIPLHSEMATRERKRGEFVDLCILDISKSKIYIQKTKFSRSERSFPYEEWWWYPKDLVGIEIKHNIGISKKKVYNWKSKRKRYTKNWEYLKSILIKDLKKLKKYKRGWLIFIDNHSLIENKKAWKTFLDELIRKSNYGYMKKTLNAYYLCPGQKRALSYKSWDKAF